MSYLFNNSYFYLEVAKGKVPGHSIAFISGRAPQVDVADIPQTIWNVQNSTYPWSVWAAGAAPIFLVSTSALDTQTVLVSGLDASYLPITALVTLSGTTPVSTGATTFLRVNSALMVTNQGAAAGVVTVHYGTSTGTIIGQIDSGFGSTSMSIYTVPAGFTAFSTYGDFSCNKGNQAELAVKWRFFGGPFITVYRSEVYQQVFSSAPAIPGRIPEKTDIDNMVQAVDNNGSRVYSNQQLLLIDNNYI